MNQLAEAMAAAEAAVQEHLVMRERQTERIRKAKAGGPKGKFSSPTLLHSQATLSPPPPSPADPL